MNETQDKHLQTPETLQVRDIAVGAPALNAFSWRNAALTSCFLLPCHVQDMGNAAAASGEYSTALRHWDAALAQRPLPQAAAVLHEQKAQCYLEVGAHWDAVRSATVATELRSDWPFGWLTLGRAQLQFGEPELAVRSFSEVLKLDSDGEAGAAARQDLIEAVAAMEEQRRRRLQQGQRAHG